MQHAIEKLTHMVAAITGPAISTPAVLAVEPAAHVIHGANTPESESEGGRGASSKLSEDARS